MKYQQDKINKSEFEDLLTHQATEREIASIYNVSIDTVIRFCKREYNQTFQEVSNTFKNKGYVCLRKKIFDEAMKGNTTLLIFLAKNYLNMSDKAENTNQEKVIIINDLKNED